MLKNRSEIRLGATAIAVVLAALSTPAVAQDASADAPAPAVEIPAPVILDVSPPETEASTSSTDAPEAAPVARRAAKPKVASTATTRRAATSRAATPSAPVAAAPAPAEAMTPADPLATTPAPLAEQPAAAAPAPVATSDDSGVAEIAFGGALALLALGGTAAVLRRRRRREADEDFAHAEEAYEPAVAVPASEPVTASAPAVAASAPIAAVPAAPLAPHRSAFSWGASAPARRNESWEERARRGPTPDNPSFSLKKRLKRAAFFDNRAREVAAGMARPIAAAAGLPDRAGDAIRPAARQGVTTSRLLQPA